MPRLNQFQLLVIAHHPIKFNYFLYKKKLIVNRILQCGMWKMTWVNM